MPWYQLTFTRQDFVADQVSAMLGDFSSAFAQKPHPDGAIFDRRTEDGGCECYFSPVAAEAFLRQLLARGAQECEQPRRTADLDMLFGDAQINWSLLDQQ